MAVNHPNFNAIKDLISHYAVDFMRTTDSDECKTRYHATLFRFASQLASECKAPLLLVDKLWTYKPLPPNIPPAEL